MTTPLNGLLGGLIVGVLAAVAAQAVRADPSVVAALLGSAGGHSRHRVRDALVQVAYGVVAGTALIVLELLVLDTVGVPASNAEAFPLAVGWSALLFVLALGALRAAVGRSLDRRTLAELFVFHLVFGFGMGAWISLTWYT